MEFNRGLGVEDMVGLESNLAEYVSGNRVNLANINIPNNSIIKKKLYKFGVITKNGDIINREVLVEV